MTKRHNAAYVPTERGIGHNGQPDIMIRVLLLVIIRRTFITQKRVGSVVFFAIFLNLLSFLLICVAK